MEQDILISPQEKEKLISLIKSKRFEEFQPPHPHFYNQSGKPRHGITLEHAKNIFEQFDKIYSIYKRRKINGFTYTFIYKINKKTSYYLIFLLDETPMKLFDAYCCGKNIEKRLFRKYGFKQRY